MHVYTEQDMYQLHLHQDQKHFQPQHVTTRQCLTAVCYVQLCAGQLAAVDKSITLAAVPDRLALFALAIRAVVPPAAHHGAPGPRVIGCAQVGVCGQ